MAADRKPHALFVYYSFTHNTSRVTNTMASVLRGRGWTVTEAGIDFTDPHYGKRFAKLPMSWPVARIVGMLPAQRRKKKTGDIDIPPAASSGEYDLVVIGSPTWWLTTCMPVRSYLRDPAAEAVLADTPFAAFSTSRRYYKDNLRTIEKLGEAVGGRFVDKTHFVAAGGQVRSMWSWLVFMRHNEARRRSFGVPLPKPNLQDDYEVQATDFIASVAEQVFSSDRADAPREPQQSP